MESGLQATVERYDREIMTEEQVETEAESPTRNRRRVWLWATGGAVVVVGAIAGLALLSGADTGETGSTVALNYGEVVRTDLVETDTYDGTLGTVEADPVKTATGGVVTAVAAAGSVVEQGGELYRIDDEPVVLLYGTTPAYRDLRLTADTATLSAQGAGVITDVVAEGTTVAQGDVLYTINEQPTVILYGDVPAYRAMRDLRGDNMEGADVLQLERALVDLGYDPDGSVTVDEEFTANTRSMVERWQADIGMVDDGVVDLGEVVFIPGPADVLTVLVTAGDIVQGSRPAVTVTSGAPLEGRDVLQLEQALFDLGFDPGAIDGVFTGATKQAVIDWQTAAGMDADGIVNLGEVVFLDDPIRVGDELATPGTAVNPGTPILAAASADKVVTFNLPAADQGVVDVGDTVVVQLPDGTEVPGTVDDVATVATLAPNGDAAFEVTVLLDDPGVAADLDEAPVDVDVVSDSVEDVVAVPVTALLALAEGGYAVEVDAGGGSTRLVAVDPGFYANGLVEITADGLDVGDRVVIP